LEEFDEFHSDDEPRFNVIGMSAQKVLSLIITRRGEETTRLPLGAQSRAGRKRIV
jgi:uncharacterized DUF497 family protein